MKHILTDDYSVEDDDHSDKGNVKPSYKIMTKSRYKTSIVKINGTHRLQ